MKKILIFLLFFSLIPIVNAQALSEKLTVDMHYIVISPANDSGILVKHMVNYTNSGNEEYKGESDDSSVLTIPLPPGALDLQVQDESLGAQQTENGFTTTKPIAPQETQVIPFSYTMPLGVPVNVKLDYPLQVMQVLIPEGSGSVVVEGAKYSNAGLMQFEEKNFWLYNVEGIEAGKELKLIYDKNTQPSPEDATVKEEPATNTDADAKEQGNVTRTAPEFHNPGHIRLWYQSPLKKFNPHILLMVLGAILLAAFSYYSYFKWKSKLEEKRIGSDKEEQLFKQLLARQNAIMDKIMELEDMHAQGEIKEEEYLAKLNAYKQHLVKVKLSLRQFVE